MPQDACAISPPRADPRRTQSVDPGLPLLCPDSNYGGCGGLWGWAPSLP